MSKKEFIKPEFVFIQLDLTIVTTDVSDPNSGDYEGAIFKSIQPLNKQRGFGAPEIPGQTEN